MKFIPLEGSWFPGFLIGPRATVRRKSLLSEFTMGDEYAASKLLHLNWSGAARNQLRYPYLSACKDGRTDDWFELLIVELNKSIYEDN